MKKNARNMNFLAYCGAHYKACPVEIRELWAKATLLAGDPELVKKTFEKHSGSKLEIIPISTCNRFDICVLGSIDETALLACFAELANISATHDKQSAAQLEASPLTPENLRSFLRWSFDNEAVHQLFRVAASLDSLVLGEPHILGQLKESFQKAIELRLCANEATALFNRCFQVAKRIRTETDLGKNGISIGHAAVEVSKRVFEHLDQKKALVVGAGEMGRIVAQHFRACGIGQLTVANRSMTNAERMARELGNTQVMPLATALSQLEKFDIVVVATGATQYLIDTSHVKLLPKMRSGNPCVIVDISVPRNVNPAIASTDNVFTFDVDDLDKIMESNREARKQAALEAEAIVQGEVLSFVQSRQQRDNLTHVGRFHTWVRAVVENEIQRSLRNREPIGPETALVIADAVAKKLVSPAASLVRTETPMQLSALENVGEALEFLFKLSEQNALAQAEKVGQNVISISNTAPKRSSIKVGSDT